jgi:DNA-binding response OmpR family regulator
MVRDVLAEPASRPAADPGESAERAGSTLHLNGPGRCVLADGRAVRLTATEFAVLAALLDQPGRVLSRRRLLAAAGRPAAGDRAADVYVAQLRAKLGSGVIRTVRGAGYAISGGQ